ncbi:MAG: AraC family transcriptional regulator [Halieaceae bacterium]|nr:AraC family transcriptional regulator [Halieaceae bacterium]
MHNSTKSTNKKHFNANDLAAKFIPGEWIDRHQIVTPSCVALGGTYRREDAIRGSLHSKDAHYYDFSLSKRPPNSKGRLVDHFLEAQPLGEVVFVPAGERYIGETGPGEQNNVFVFLDSTRYEQEDLEIARAAKTPEKQCFMDLHNDRIRFLLTQISKELYDQSFASDVMIEGLSITLIAETARMLNHLQRPKVMRGGLAPANLRKVIDRIMAGGAPPGLEELASLCNLSRRHLMRSFQQSTGQTIGEFIKNKTFEKAQVLLTKSDMPIGEVAIELGFVNTSSFSTAFRRMTGQSPRTFRVQQTPTGLKLPYVNRTH